MFKNKLLYVLLCTLGINNVFATCLVSTEDTQLCETTEILYSSGEATTVSTKATELGSPVKIYEYLRNNSEYTAYHGARSSSLNSMLGLRGNDVDLASTLIAMLRSRGIKTRYVAGDIKLDKSAVANWLGVIDNDLAVAILNDHGIQNIDSTDPVKVVFQHVWVEALLNYDNYRAGNTAQSVACTTEGGACKWVSLDVSYKQKKYKESYRMLLRNLNFNYKAYYNAETPSSPDYVAGMKDKNPLEIYEEQALAYLRTNHPGATLEDVIDKGEIISDTSGLLPASMPYEVVGTPERFDSVQDYDLAHPATKWTKYLTSKMGLPGCSSIGLPSYKVSLAELSTKQLTLTMFIDNTTKIFAHRLDGVKVGSSISAGGSITFICGAITTVVQIGTPMNVSLEMDAAPGDPTIKTTYENLTFGGYYLIASGGETSNWTQVKRAYNKLLKANQQYPIVVDTAGTIGVVNTVYVDENKDGLPDVNDTPLLNHLSAQDALTGGLLYVAQSIYYTRLREESNRYSKMKGIVSPISGYLGLVSTTHEVEYLDGVPFAVTPGGLLIDLKGIRVNGSWEIDKAAVYSNETFKFLGHVASSLEHEVWQEITGYDAISTMRGIQLALSSGRQLLDVKNNSTSNTFPTDIYTLGFSSTVPAGFTQHQYSLFNRQLVTWSYSGTEVNPGFNMVLPDASNLAPTATAAKWLVYNANTNLNNLVASFDNLENQLIALNPLGSYGVTCNNIVYQDFPVVLLTNIETCFNDIVASIGMTETIDYLDVNKGFNPANHAYRSYTLNIDEHDLGFIQTLRSNMYFLSDPNAWSQFVLPSRLSVGSNYVFNVFINNTYLSNDLVSSTYGIANHSNRLVAGGGYVTAEKTVVPATSTEFNNEVFTNLNLVSVTNNDVIRTPSTADPVSTVTGNMYHDETDFIIKGRGLDYAFTRTYNSDQIKTNTASNLPLSKGWTHSYNMRLIANDYGKFPNYTATVAPENGNGTTSSITYINERGGEENYLVDDVNATWAITSPKMNFDTLQLDTPAIGSYTITYRNGVKYIFTGADLKVPGNSARLSRIEDPYGNHLLFNYTGDQLTSITDNLNIAGRTGLTLSYYPIGDINVGHLKSITDWSGRTWTYSYTNGKLTGVTNPLSYTNNYTYVKDSYGVATDLLKDIIQPEGRGGKFKTMTFSYYENDQAYSYIDQLGNIELLTYDLFRKRTRITNPRGYITEHYYDKNGAMIKLVEPDKGILLFENNTDGLRYLKRDALGNPTTYSYNSARTLDGAASDTFGQVTREQDALGNTVDYSYGIYDQITDVKNKNNVHMVKSYYATTDIPTGALAGKLSQISMPAITVNGVTQSNVVLSIYKYNGDGTVKQIEEMIDPATPTRKRITNLTYVYDANGMTLTKVISGTTTGGSVTTVQVYDNLWRLTSESVQRRTSSTDATIILLTTNYEYDVLNRPVRITDAFNNITETTYDKNGKIKQVIKRFATNNPAINLRTLHTGCSIDAGYPNHHSCVVSTNSYDAADRLISKTDLNGNTTSYQYDPMGNVTKITNKRGHSLYNKYDQKGRLIQVKNENAYSVKTDYDLAGRVIATTDPNNNKTTFNYDALGRKTSITTPMGRVTTFDQYDGNGNLIRSKDANAVSGKQPVNLQGSSIYKTYDEFNRVVSEVNANNENTFYTYDLLGNLTKLTDAKGQITQFIYDDLSRLIKVIDPIIESPTDKTKVYTHDEVGNVLTTTDHKGEVTRTTYDRANRATLVEYLTDATTQTARYNQYGELDQITNPTVTYNYTYDNQQRMTQKLDSRTAKSLNWVYDATGNVIKKTDYQGNITNYTFDDTNRLVAMANQGLLQASYHYDGAGRLLSRILSNGTATLYQYDKDGLLIKLSQRSADGTVVDERTYQHDDIGNITQVVITGGETINYSYDPGYRLTSATSSIAVNNQTFTYDAAGNRSSMTNNTNSYHYIYGNGNRLNEVRTGSITGPVLYSYVYDDNGSRIAKRNGSVSIIESYVYDQRRLISSVTNGSSTTNFTYDPNAYRVQKKTGISENNYLLEAEHLEATYDENNQLKASYLRGVVVDEIIGGLEKDTNGKMQYRNYHHDQVNSVTTQTDHNGQTVQTNSYTPFGVTRSSTGSSTNALNYTGREQDSNNLYYYRARYYDPEVGRFLSEDPLGFKAGINFYAYVKNNPLSFNDPYGKQGYNYAQGLIPVEFFQKVAEYLPGVYGGYSVQANAGLIAGAGGTVRGRFVSGTENGNPVQKIIPSIEGTTNVIGASAGRGIEGGFVFGDVSDFNKSTQFAVDTPIGGFSLFITETGPLSAELNGVGLQGPSVGFSMSATGGETLLPSGVFNYEADLGAIFNGASDFAGTIFDDQSSFGTPSTQLGSWLGLQTLNSNAYGGYVLYPNKLNLNMSRNVYSK